MMATLKERERERVSERKKERSLNEIDEPIIFDNFVTNNNQTVTMMLLALLHML